jgi:hypothetical protein
MLLTGSGGDLCGPLTAPFQAAAYHLPSVGLSAFPAFVYCKFVWRSAPCPFPPLWCTQNTLPSLLCVPFLLFTFFFCRARGQSVQGATLVYPNGGCGNTTCCLFAHLLVCWMSPKQVWSWHLELASGGTYKQPFEG